MTATWRGDSNGDGSYDTLLDQVSGVTTATNISGSWSAFAGNDVQVNVTLSSTGSDEAFVLEEDGVEASATPPDVDNSSATPTGTITSTTLTFEIDVEDADSPTAQGDQVNASLYIDGSLEGSDTLTANGTASVTASSLSGGSHDYWWVVNDSYGHSTRSSNFSVSSPSELSVFNESAPTQLVDNTTVELRFYADEISDAPLIFTRNTTDGTINMTGVPAAESFIVVATADGYYDRRIFVPSIFETQELYLLPENESGTETIFSIKDYSGDFPQDQTVLLVQRSINGTYTTVLGDYFGATGQFPAVIETGVRHRLVLYNTETGERQVAGTYTPLSASTQTVTVSPEGTVEVEGLDIVIDVDPSTRRLPAANDTSITVNVRDGQNATVANWSVTATVVNESNSTVVWTYGQSGAGSQSNTLNLTGYAGGELVVNVTANSTAGQMTSDSVTFRLDPVFDNDRSLLAIADRLVSLSPEQGRSDFTTFLAISLTIFLVGVVATQLPVSGDVAAFVGVLAIAGFTIIGWTSPGLLFVTGVGFVGFAALRRGL